MLRLSTRPFIPHLKSRRGPIRCCQRFYHSADDHYETLRVPPSASVDEVKAAYKKLALEFHPDRNTSPGAEDTFKRISEAYSIVGNKTKRQQYDAQRGSTSQRGHRSDSTTASNGPHRKMSKSEADQLFQEIFGHVGNLDELFKNMERDMRQRSTGRQPLRPHFFQQGFESIISDAAGNRQEHKSFRDPRGKIFNVFLRSSSDPNASTNMSNEEYHQNRATVDQEQKARMGGTFPSFESRYASLFPKREWFRTGQHPLYHLLVTVLLGTVVAGVFLGVMSFFVANPVFIFIVVFLGMMMSRRRYF